MKISLNEFSSEISWFPNPIYGKNRAPVFFYNQKVFRGILPEYEDEYLKFFNSGLYEHLIKFDLIPPARITNFSFGEFTLVIEQNRLPWVIYPQEWTFLMLQKAAECVLTVNQICADYGYETYDCHGFNLLFNGLNPQFVDLGSFLMRSNDIHWSGLNEFISRYLYPLKLWSNGQSYLAKRLLSDNYWNRFLSTDTTLFEGFESLINEKVNFENLKSLVRSFKKNKGLSVWHNYHDKLYKSDGTVIDCPRFEKILEIVKRLDIKTAHDVGGNAGAFTQLCLEKTQIEKCICSDIDENAIDLIYERNLTNPLITANSSAVLLNILSPIHNYGLPPLERYKCDAVFALALMHHLILVARSPISFILKSFHDLTNKYVFIEFMPFSHLSSDSRTVPEGHEFYTEKWFEAEFVKYFDLLRVERLELNRILFVGQKNELSVPVKKNQVLQLKMQVSVPILIILSGKKIIDVLKKFDYLNTNLMTVAVIGNSVADHIFVQLTKQHPNLKVLRISATAVDPVYKAIDLFLKENEMGIIIEDGFEPNRAFFWYAEQLLKYYKNDSDILQMSGINFIDIGFENDASYFFTKLFYCGVFATWKDRWIRFKRFNEQPLVKTSKISNRFMKLYSNKAKKNWRYRWQLYGMFNNLLAVLLSRNTVKFPEDKKIGSFKYYECVSASELDFLLKHPAQKKVNSEYDRIINSGFFNPILPYFQQETNAKDFSISIFPKFSDMYFNVGEYKKLHINLTNNGSSVLSSLPPNPVYLSYHWNVSRKKSIIYDGLRTNLKSTESIDLGGLNVPRYLFLLPDENRDFFMDVRAPDLPGNYLLILTAVVEGCFWLDELSKKNSCVLKIQVEQVEDQTFSYRSVEAH